MRQLKSKFFVFFFMLSCALGLANVANAASSNDPVALLQSIADNMIRGLKQNQANLKSKPQVVYSLAYKYVVPYANMNEMSRRVLPPQVWNSATPQERAQFQKQFTRTLIRTYASALSEYKDQTIKFYPVRGGYQGKNNVEVRGQIESSDRPPIQVTYRLVRTGSSWRLFDLSVEGVAMLDSFRSQFSDILAQGNMQQLLQRMSTHNDR
jgi:phospholipid transport system substrate-binding protein